MNRKAMIAIIVVVILAIGAGAYALTKNSNNNTASTNQPTSSSGNSTNTAPSSSPSTNNSSSSDQSSGATITYSDSGFSPATLTVKAGTIVTIKNTSSQDMQFDSDPHPVHTDDPQLNVGIVAPGKSMTFTPTTTGTHGYHNHLNSSQTGTLIVQ